MTDNFFNKTECDRCGKKLVARTMSWFTEETICMTCSNEEEELRGTLPQNGKEFEGCGYVPKENVGAEK